MQLSELRKEMRFNMELVSLIDTLKNIASSRYHALERDKERFERFMEAFTDFFRVVNLVDVDEPLVRVATDVLGVVIVTSDSGFMGGLNAGVINKAYGLQGDLRADKISFIVVGDKGAGVLSDAGRKFKYFRGIAEETRYEQALELADYIVGEVQARRIGRVVMVYPKPVSFSQQKIETIHVLPCAELFDKGATQAETVKAKGLDALVAGARKAIVESSFSDMVAYLSKTWVASKLYEVFEDSKLAEYGARAIHLEGSHQKLEKTKKKLQHQFFRASHEKIDKGMRESFSAGNIRKKKRKAEAMADAKTALLAENVAASAGR
jgi:ATP synthase F1 gamma subunit